MVGSRRGDFCALPIRLVDEVNQQLAMGTWGVLEHALEQGHPALNPGGLLVQALIPLCQGVSVPA